MANAPFTEEQLDFLSKHFAPLPHDHTWEQVKDADGETLSARVLATDESLDDIEERLGALEGDNTVEVD